MRIKTRSLMPKNKTLQPVEQFDLNQFSARSEQEKYAGTWLINHRSISAAG
jgi:hypothetical protein